MRDSNPRGVAPNTLSTSAFVRSARFVEPPGLGGHTSMDPAAGRRTAVNETATETAVTPAYLRGATSQAAF
jgi:hypothetical protein